MNPYATPQIRRLSAGLPHIAAASRTHLNLSCSHQETCLLPDVAAYTSLLQNCDCFKGLSDGMCIHHHIVKNGLDHVLPLSNRLLQMYGRCSSVEMAKILFVQMPKKDTYSWNYMIRAHTRQGQCKDAFFLFRRMQEEGLVPNSYIFSSLLSANNDEVGLHEGKQVHVQVAGSGCSDDVFVGTALVGMYGKCGRVEDAESVFVQMQKQDLTLWNTMIALYIEHGLPEDALRLYYKMSMEGAFPTDVTYLSILNACNNPSDGKRIHLNVLFHECKEDAIVGTAFLNMYGKLGLLDNARRIFDDIQERDAVCWNAMVGVCAQNGENTAAIQLFQRMCQEALVWDKYTFSSALSSCANEGALTEGKRVHAFLCACGFNSDTMMGNALVNMYGKSGDLKDSWEIFCGLRDRDVISWNVIIAAHAQHNGGRSSLQLFEQMHQEGVLPNNITFVSILEVCSNDATKQVGERLHASVFVTGLHLDTAVGNALVNVYGNSGRLKEAQMLVEEIPRKDRTTYINFLLACTSKGALEEGQRMHSQIVAVGFDSMLAVATAIIAMYGKSSCVEDAWVSFVRLSERDVILWTAIIAAFLYNGLAKDALRLFEEMQTEGMKADRITVVSILDACADHVALGEGRRMHDHVMVRAFESDLVVGTAVLNMYSRCGMLEDACRVFRDLPGRDIVAWSVIVAAHAQQGHAKEAQILLDQMREEGMVPNEVTFIGILNACSHSGLVDEGREWFRSMKTTHGILPVVDHYNCMIDLLARAGLMEEAEALVKDMPMTPTSTTWTTLLGACRDQFDTQRGDLAAENVIELAPEKISPYVTLSNIYMAAERENDATKLFDYA
eukprot:c23686_g11_i3 orf=235-2754(-)